MAEINVIPMADIMRTAGVESVGLLTPQSFRARSSEIAGTSRGKKPRRSRGAGLETCPTAAARRSERR
jgi:hypothetical protein